MRQMTQPAKSGRHDILPAMSVEDMSYPHTPNDTAGKRQMRQCFYAKRDRKPTPNEAGIMRQTKQEKHAQVLENIDDFASVLMYLVLKYSLWIENRA